MSEAWNWLTAIDGSLVGEALVDDAFPAPGRRRMEFDEARALLVQHDHFQESGTREGLWAGLEQYLGRFVQLEDRYADTLESAKLVEFIWLGGSYVSSKVEPSNIDITVAVNQEARAALRSRPGAKWLVDAFARDSVRTDFGLSPLCLPYRSVANVFRDKDIEGQDLEYLRRRGAWDDWWQRCRTSTNSSPTKESARPMRGYLEVPL